MSFFQPPNFTRPIATAAQLMSQLRMQGVGQYQAHKRAFLAMSALFWNNDDVSPQQNAAELASNGVNVFNQSARTLAYLNEFETDENLPLTPSPVPQGWTITPNQDGTVTLSPPASSSSSSSSSGAQ